MEFSSFAAQLAEPGTLDRQLPPFCAASRVTQLSPFTASAPLLFADDFLLHFRDRLRLVKQGQRIARGGNVAFGFKCRLAVIVSQPAVRQPVGGYSNYAVARAPSYSRTRIA